MSKRRLMVLIVLLELLLLVRQQPARAAAPPGPEDVARVALGYIKEDRVEDFARAMHPAALTEMKTALLGIFDEAAKSGHGAEVLALFEGVKNANGLKSLDDVAFMAAYLRGTTKQIPGLKDLLKKMDMQVVGHIPEGNDKVYVVYRSKLLEDREGAGTLKVIGLRKNGPGWGMLLADDMEVVLLMLKQKIEGKGAMPKFDMAASTVEPLGQILEGDKNAHLVFRLTTPVNDSRVSKISVLSATNTDPEWSVVRNGNKEAVTRLIEQSMGLKKPAPAVK